MKSKTIAKFIKDDDGVSVEVYSTESIDILVGIAETIQLISKKQKKIKEYRFRYK